MDYTLYQKLKSIAEGINTGDKITVKKRVNVSSGQTKNLKTGKYTVVAIDKEPKEGEGVELSDGFVYDLKQLVAAIDSGAIVVRK